MKIAIFPGTFDPFTVGHQNIVERGLSLFDKIIVGIGCNTSKQCTQTPEQRQQGIAQLYQENSKIEVKTYNTLTVDFAKEVGAKFILRGVRSLKDFDYEREIADVNRQLSGIETVILFSEGKMSEISSTLVRELQAFGKDVSDFLPRNS